jgi:hypothetical protein
MLPTLNFQPRPPIRRRVHAEEPPAAPAPPVALTLVSASYDLDSGSVILAFDRAVNASAYDPAQITLDDGVYAGGLFVGSGPATVVNPTTIQVFLEQVGSPTVSDVELSATALTGIVAVDDGGTWEGVTNLVLPFP